MIAYIEYTCEKFPRLVGVLTFSVEEKRPEQQLTLFYVIRGKHVSMFTKPITYMSGGV